MLKWLDVIRFVDQGNLEPDLKVAKTDDEWRAQLTEEQYQVTRQHGTERPFSSDMCSLFEPGLYACVCCDTLLFDANEKFESGTGWPSFTQPIRDNAIAYFADNAHGMKRIEVRCNNCDAHQGHVFPDGPEPSGLRYCINAIAMNKVEVTEEKATFGGGCFWCTEAMFQQLRGVKSVESGYTGGELANPSYREICTGTTGHAEVIQVTYDPREIDYADLLRMHFASHDPTTLNQQGADRGTQYRSAIFPHNEQQQATAKVILQEMQAALDGRVVTTIEPMTGFYRAEDYHQNYYQNNADAGYCQVVVSPKLTKFRAQFKSQVI